MLKLLSKDNLLKEELETLDKYFFNEKIEDLLLVDNAVIIKFIEQTEKVLGFSLTKTELEIHLLQLSFDYKVFFYEEELILYDKVLELINYFSFKDAGLAYAMGDYYFNNNKKTEALKYYKMIFKKGFNLCDEDYFDSLVRYIEILDNKGSNVLKELIDNSPVDDYNLEFVNTKLLLINCLDKNSNEYINTIDSTIEITLPLVRKYQSELDEVFISDSDIERNLCELLALKMQYYVNKKEYKIAYNVYNELTDEIGESGCMRYYHARDLFYDQMILQLSEEFAEVKFLNDIDNKTFEIISEGDNLTVNEEIILKDKKGRTLKFIIESISDETEIVIAPILPIIGVGGLIFTTLVIKNNKKYLKNRL